MNQPQQIIEADLTYHDGRFVPHLQVGIDAEGRISGVGKLGVATRRMTGRALLPGFVNVHSHAFQRALRGFGETFPEGQGDFWSWREAMYKLVQRIDRASMKRLCKLAFEEMLDAGITTVGEFHYLHHHDPNVCDYSLDEIVLHAAAETGIRLVMLASYYRTGGVGAPLTGGQRHFATNGVEDFLRQVDRLARQVDSRTQTIGLAPHSVRAVPLADLRELAAAAKERGWVCHMHVEEQRKEIEEFRAAHEVNPLNWMLDHLDVDERYTIVHGTHSDPEDMVRFVGRGGHVCVCPLTEGNLGDGINNPPAMSARPGRICVGTDSNVRLDMFEEIRWFEFVQRLHREKRGVLRRADGELAGVLLDCATINGASSLALPTGRIEAGRWADLVAVDLTHRTVEGFTAESLAAHLVFGTGRDVIRKVCVGGRWVRG
ncbi:MAG: formimidoylglutamate deiminase [Phycisphaerales bacterium]|nr:formimidoylglutamate deiminase [Phycisphaerales bacterium]